MAVSSPVSLLINLVVALLVVLLACTPAAAHIPAKPAEQPAIKPIAGDRSADQTPFTVGFLQGMTDVPVGVIQQLGLDKKYQVNVGFKQFGDPDSLNDAWFLKQITFQPGMDTAKASIRKLQSGFGLAIYPAFKATNRLVVKPDSTIRSLADLRGRRIAVMSTTGSEFMILKWVLKTDYGIDLLKDVDPRSVPPPVALQLLQQGEVEGALLFEPWVSRAMITIKARILWDIQDEWQKRKGKPLWFSAIHVDDAFARAHPNAVKRYLMAYKEAVDYINANPREVYAKYKEPFKIADETDFELLIKNHEGVFTTKWDDSVIDSIKQYLQLAVDEGMLQRVPDDLFTKEFAP